jgi:hypothetical protein
MRASVHPYFSEKVTQVAQVQQVALENMLAKRLFVTADGRKRWGKHFSPRGLALRDREKIFSDRVWPESVGKRFFLDSVSIYTTGKRFFSTVFGRNQWRKDFFPMCIPSAAEENILLEEACPGPEQEQIVFGRFQPRLSGQLWNANGIANPSAHAVALGGL